MSFSGTKGYRTKPKPGVGINYFHPLSRGLMGCWLMSDGAGSMAHDASGRGNHGNLKGMTPNAQDSGWGGSKFGGELRFSGANQYVDCGNHQSVNFGVGDFSVTMVIRTTTTGSYQLLIGRHHDPGFEVYISSGNKAYYQIGDGTGWITKEGNVIIADGALHTVTIVFNRTANGTIYVDGVFDAENNISAKAGSTDSANHIRLGLTTTGSYPYTGAINMVYLHNRVLRLWEIELLHNDPFCNLLMPPLRRYYIPAAGPTGVIMNQFQNFNIGADLYNGAIIA